MGGIVMEKVFYMLFMEGGNAPVYKHLNFESAEAEAKRLTSLHGKKIYILKAIKSIMLNNFTEEVLDDSELPF